MKLVKILVAVGAINWLLVAFNWNLVEAIFGRDTMLTNIVYVVVGVSGLLLLVKVFTCKECSKKCDSCSTGKQDSDLYPTDEADDVEYPEEEREM